MENKVKNVPHCFGLDYGTTTSLLYEFAKGKTHRSVDPCKSAVKVYDGKVTHWGDDALISKDPGYVVPSPKRRFFEGSGGDINGVDINMMIVSTLEHLLNNQSQSLPGCHITLTVPNHYAASHYTTMYSLLTTALSNASGMSNTCSSIHFLPEPVAAALYYIHNIQEQFNYRKFIVCDIGGGTTDLTIVSCSRKGRSLKFRVEKNQQSDFIGGDVLTKRLAEHLGIDPQQLSPTDWNALQNMKHNLSKLPKAPANLSTGDIFCSRQEFEEAIPNELDKLRSLMQKLRDNCGLTVDSSWSILRVGGTCRIPAIQLLLREVFPEVTQIFDAEPSDIFYSVAQGAAFFSAYEAKQLKDESGHDFYDSIVIVNRTPHQISYRNANNEWVQIVPQNAPDNNETHPYYTAEHLHLIDPIINSDDTYCVGQITLRDGLESMEWPDSKNIHFQLHGRCVKDIRLTLGIKICNSRLRSCHITDESTKETQSYCWE